jgi:hypothetical protein
MGTRPTDYFLEYECPELEAAIVASGFDPAEVHPMNRLADRDATTEADARRIAAELRATEGVGYIAVYRRADIEDVTPPEDGVGRLWDWEPEFVDDDF